MKVDSIVNGIVIDHIAAGKAMTLYRLLELDKLDCPVAVIQNAPSEFMGKKDIIKIDSDVDVNLDVIGYVSPNVTVNIIRNEEIVEKKHLSLPKKLTNIIRCKNPRCITTSESQLDAIFFLSDAEKHTYRCAYCETEESRKKF